MHLGPPLRRWERRLIWLWCITTGAAWAAIAWGVFWWWIALIVTIPFGFGAFFAPTLWLYLTPALLVWLLLRWRLRLGLYAAGASMAVVAVGVPNVMNRQLEATLREAVASDSGNPVAIGDTGGAIAWLQGEDEPLPGADAYCGYECLRFLITGRAQAVLIGPALRGLPDPDRQYLRIHLVPWSDDRGCPLPAGVKDLVHVPHLSLIDPDKCAAFDRVPLRTARLIYNQQQPARQNDIHAPFLGVSLKRREIYGWQAGRPKLLTRRTDASAPKVTVPLALWPYDGADTSTPAQWGSAGAEYRAGTRLPLDPITMVAENMFVPAFDNPQ